MTTKMKEVFFGTIVAAVCVVGMASTVAAKQVVIGTGATAAENIFFKIKEPMETSSGDIKLVIIVGGPVQAIKDLEIGMVETAVGGVTFADWMTMMEKANFTIPDKKAYKSQVIGQDIIQVITNKDVKVSSLSKEQLEGIFSGKTKNWSEVGGQDMPIMVFLNTQSPGTQLVFQKQLLHGEAYGPEAIALASAGEVKTRVRRTPGAIALATQGQVDGTINVPTIPIVERPITLITKGAPSEGLEKVLEYIRGPGQQYIVKK